MRLNLRNGRKSLAYVSFMPKSSQYKRMHPLVSDFMEFYTKQGWIINDPALFVYHDQKHTDGSMTLLFIKQIFNFYPEAMAIIASVSSLHFLRSSPRDRWIICLGNFVRLDRAMMLIPLFFMIWRTLLWGDLIWLLTS